MQCAQCRCENESDAQFCEACGSNLARLCRSCGRELKPTARFCPGCGGPADVDATVAVPADL